MLRIHRILCPVDFFPASERAVDYAIALARKNNAGLILMHVVSPMIGEVPDTVSKAARTELNKLVKRSHARGVQAEAVLRIGEVDLAIQSVVHECKADFIVMGAHGRRGLEKFFIGSVTERMLRRVTVPLLIIGNTKTAGDLSKIRHILAITDFAAGTEHAMAHAFSIAQTCSAGVTLLHVLDDVVADVSGSYRNQLIQGVRSKLDNLVPENVRNSCDVTTRVETGWASRRILPIVKNEKIDLIVMNIHGKTLLDRAMTGSTAEGLVRAAVTPVLVVPPPAETGRRRRPSSRAA